jgi:UTP--glucose-1-phosphate uridylyltransferase
MKMRVRKAVFPAAGLGTRFLPATKAQPKEMLPLVDKPIIQYGVEEALAAGCDQIIIITGRGKTAIEDWKRCWKNAARRSCSPSFARFQT